MDLTDIIEKAGGAGAIAHRLGCSKDATRKWARIGIPDRHWPVLIEMSGGAFGPQDLYDANVSVRAASEEAA